MKIIVQGIRDHEYDIQPGMEAKIVFAGDIDGRVCKIVGVHEDIKNGEPGVDVIDDEGRDRWAYADQIQWAY